ncbi:MAG TPA: hypothetical protein VIF62_14360 [Labilithrix sp.]
MTAAVVGVIANLAFFFAVHALFGRFDALSLGPAHVSVPVIATVRLSEAALAIAALIATFRFHVSVPKLVGAFAAAGVVLHFVG